MKTRKQLKEEGASEATRELERLEAEKADLIADHQKKISTLEEKIEALEIKKEAFEKLK